jgi:hypothetical protein
VSIEKEPSLTVGLLPRCSGEKIMKMTRASVVLFVFLLGFAGQASAQETKLKWFGHAAFSITTPKGKVLLIDPWLSNPSNPS